MAEKPSSPSTIAGYAEGHGPHDRRAHAERDVGGGVGRAGVDHGAGEAHDLAPQGAVDGGAHGFELVAGVAVADDGEDDVAIGGQAAHDLDGPGDALPLHPAGQARHHDEQRLVGGDAEIGAERRPVHRGGVVLADVDRVLLQVVGAPAVPVLRADLGGHEADGHAPREQRRHRHGVQLPITGVFCRCSP